MMPTNPVNGDNITQLFLYGSLGTPSNLTDRLMDLPPNVSGASIDVDIQSYMNTYGKYAVAARSEFVQDFFSGSILLSPGTYTVSQLKQTHLESLFRFSYVNAQVDIGNNSYMDRAYIFGHSSFYLSDDTEFHVSLSGECSISNMSIIPEDDNFDFISTGVSQYLNDYLLQPVIDPSNMGRTVDINFTGSADEQAYTNDSYASDLARISAWDGSQVAAVAAIGGNIIQYVEGMRGRGVFENSRAGKEIIYDGVRDNIVSASGNNAAIIIGGTGADQITGSAYSDIIYGGDGNDWIVADSGSDLIYGGNEPDLPKLQDTDTVDYSQKSYSLNIVYDGTTELQVNSWGGNSKLLDIENVVGGSGKMTITISSNISQDLDLTLQAGSGGGHILRAPDQAIEFIRP